jgi:hypothetical protein
MKKSTVISLRNAVGFTASQFAMFATLALSRINSSPVQLSELSRLTWRSLHAGGHSQRLARIGDLPDGDRHRNRKTCRGRGRLDQAAGGLNSRFHRCWFNAGLKAEGLQGGKPRRIFGERACTHT